MILVVGDAMLDVYQHGASTRQVPEAPGAPVITITEVTDAPGGCLNTAACLTALGQPVRVVCVVGYDEEGRRLEDLCPGSYDIIPCTGATTVKRRLMLGGKIIARIDTDRQGEKEYEYRCLDDMVSYILHNEEIDCLVLSDYGKGLLAHPERMITEARSLKVPVIVDPKGKNWAKYRGCTAIKPNEKECIEIGEMMATADYVVQTRGQWGMLVTGPSGQMVLPPTTRQQIDCTGAGDQVIAALAAFHRRGWLEACKIANIVAGMSVEYPGVHPITLSEARNECRKYGIFL